MKKIEWLVYLITAAFFNAIIGYPDYKLTMRVFILSSIMCVLVLIYGEVKEKIGRSNK
jgi:hypothetical protein